MKVNGRRKFKTITFTEIEMSYKCKKFYPQDKSQEDYCSK